MFVEEADLSERHIDELKILALCLPQAAVL